MNRNWLLAHWRRVAMQGALCGVFAVTVGLAALTVHQKRLALRLPLGKPFQVGRLQVAVPRAWSVPAISDETSGGDAVSSDEILPDGVPGRRLSVQRVRASEGLSPLEHLLRTPFLSSPHLQRLDVASWPGVMVTRSIKSLGGRRVQKQVLACAVIPPTQAIVIQLEGPYELDVADEELVREMAETISLRDDRGLLAQPQTAGTVELGDGVFVPIPDHFHELPLDPNRTSRDLLADGSAGAWTSIELIPCLWLPGDDESAFLSMLAARERDWRSGPVKKLGAGTWQVDRVDGSTHFPSRAYCLTNGDDQAIIAIMHGGFDSDQLFDPAWKTISANVRFAASRDLPALLRNGLEQVEQLVQDGADQFLVPQAGLQDWSLWDQSENADKQRWMRLEWRPKIPASASPATDDGPEAAILWEGVRYIWPDPPSNHRPPTSLLRLYGGEPDEVTHQSWSGTTDFTQYSSLTDRVISIRGHTTQRAVTQSWELRDGKLRNLLSLDAAKPAPEPFVPSGWLPLVLGKLSDKPMVLRTESFIGCDGASHPELLTLYINHGSSTAMRCVTVTVNGTGRISRWWYDLDGSLGYIDFANGMRAQRGDPGMPPRQ